MTDSSRKESTEVVRGPLTGSSGKEAMASTEAKDGKASSDPVRGRQEGKATLDLVQGKLEELMSKQSLAEDAVIQQHMNAQLYIPLAILVGHHGLADLGVDIGLLLAAARRSDKLVVDEDHFMVKPLFKHKRSTLILRELPEGIEESELRELFATCSEKESLTSVKPDVNRTAYVTFKTDESAQTAALWLRSQKLRGESIKCAMKSEHFMRSFFPAAPPSHMMTHYVVQGDQVMWGTPPWMLPGGGQQQYHPWQATGYVYDGSQEYWGHQGMDAPQDETTAGGFKGKYGKGGGRDHGKGKGKGRRRRKGGGGYNETPEDYGAMMSGGAEFGGAGAPGPGEVAQMDVTGTPLQGHAADPGGVPAAPAVAVHPPEGDAMAVEEEQSGYTHDYRKYSLQQIMEICNNMDEILKPASYVDFEKEHPDGQALFRQTPCKEWAPQPTPQMNYMMDHRGSDASEYDGIFGGRRSRAGSGWSQRPRSGSTRRSRLGTEGSVGSWNHRPRSGSSRRNSTQEGSGSWHRPRSGSTRRTRDTQEAKAESDWSAWGERSSGPRWVVKNKSNEADESTQAEAKPEAQKSAWGEKSGPKWTPKSKPSDAEAEESSNGPSGKTP